jgi:hypothetical protein
MDAYVQYKMGCNDERDAGHEALRKGVRRFLSIVDLAARRQSKGDVCTYKTLNTKHHTRLPVHAATTMVFKQDETRTKVSEEKRGPREDKNDARKKKHKKSTQRGIRIHDLLRVRLAISAVKET